MNRKYVAIGGILLFFSVVASLTVFTTAYTALQSINPVAAIAAIIIVLIGVVWLKKSNS